MRKKNLSFNRDKHIGNIDMHGECTVGKLNNGGDYASSELRIKEDMSNILVNMVYVNTDTTFKEIKKQYNMLNKFTNEILEYHKRVELAIHDILETKHRRGDTK